MKCCGRSLVLSLDWITVRTVPGSGTYTVNANCTGAWTTNIEGVPPMPAEIVIVDRAREILVNAVSATGVSSGRLRRK